MHTDKMTHAVTCIIEESWTVHFKKNRLSRKISRKYVSRNSAEKNTASRNL